LKILFSLILFAIIIFPSYAQPQIKDNDYVVQKYVQYIEKGATTMAFEGNDTILVLEKENGQVRVIHNGILLDRPAVDENVTYAGEQGMLGITTVGTKVYLYFTESDHDGGKPLGKRVYSYDWNGTNLIHKTLIRDLHPTRVYHNSGAMVTDKNGSVYLVVGDAGSFGKLQNHSTGEPDDTSVILRIAPPGPYYAIGIRNSFGLAIDPITGNMWDTENGPDFGDEINIVPPGFNSGWDVIQGPANKTELAALPGYPGYTYHDPQFTWWKPVAPTGLSFINSKEFAKYNSTLFVGDCNHGNLYKFDLNKNRDGFVFKTPTLHDKVYHVGDPMDEILFGTDFGCITDIVAGSDGLLYIVSMTDGAIYRIIPRSMLNNDSPSTMPNNSSPSTDYSFVIYIIAAIIAGILLFFVSRLFKSRPKIEA